MGNLLALLQKLDLVQYSYVKEKMRIFGHWKIFTSVCLKIPFKVFLWFFLRKKTLLSRF